MYSEQEVAIAKFDVVVNDEAQYSIWAVDKDLPKGWYRDGFSGDKDACLAHIERTWVDMRPLSVRSAL